MLGEERVIESKKLSTVYGPIRSWRYGNSLGVDLLLHNSICSFNCIYCQLGDIQIVTSEQKVYVPTEQVVEDLKQADMASVDLITFSGSGEPTLATNLGEVIHHVKQVYHKPVMILTNATLFRDPATRARVMEADIVDCKLDGASDGMLQRFNRPAKGITLQGIVEGIKALRKEFPGQLHMQCMFMPINLSEAEDLAKLIRDIKPDLVQLNTPRRPHPTRWDVLYRHSEGGETGIKESPLKTISLEQAGKIEEILKSTGVPIVSVYRSQ